MLNMNYVEHEFDSICIIFENFLSYCGRAFSTPADDKAFYHVDDKRASLLTNILPPLHLKKYLR